jgi:hypothetical protein
MSKDEDKGDGASAPSPDFPLKMVLSINLSAGVVHFQNCDAKIDCFLDLFGMETDDSDEAVSVIVQVPLECPVGPGLWLAIDLGDFHQPTYH